MNIIKLLIKTNLLLLFNLFMKILKAIINYLFLHNHKDIKLCLNYHILEIKSKNYKQKKKLQAKI